MIQVWKCDYCSTTDVDYKKIQHHEPTCSFNKLNKKCHTCKYSYEEGYNGEHIPGCEINHDTLIGEDDGNCPDWVYEYLDEEREEKINQII
jgi:hypothetical protein